MVQIPILLAMLCSYQFLSPSVKKLQTLANMSVVRILPTASKQKHGYYMISVWRSIDDNCFRNLKEKMKKKKINKQNKTKKTLFKHV